MRKPQAPHKRTQVQLIIQELKTLIADPALKICTECLLKAEDQLFEQAKAAESNNAQNELIDAVSLLQNNRQRLAPELAEALARKLDSLDRSQPIAFPSKAITRFQTPRALVLVKQDDFEDFLSLTEAIARVDLRYKDALLPDYKEDSRFCLGRRSIERRIRSARQSCATSLAMRCATSISLPGSARRPIQRWAHPCLRI